VVPRRLQKEPWYWLVERKLVFLYMTSSPRDMVAVAEASTDASL